jgi:hypothetical protein
MNSVVTLLSVKTGKLIRSIIVVLYALMHTKDLSVFPSKKFSVLACDVARNYRARRLRFNGRGWEKRYLSSRRPAARDQKREERWDVTAWNEWWNMRSPKYCRTNVLYTVRYGSVPMWDWGPPQHRCHCGIHAHLLVSSKQRKEDGGTMR